MRGAVPLGLAGLVVMALILLTGATSQAQTGGLAPAYGGGSLQAKVPTTRRQYADATAVALVPAGDAMRVRVSLLIRCSNLRGGVSGDDLLLRVPLRGDGSFGGVERVRSDELGSARVKVTGVVTPTSATGTVDVRSLKGRQRCRSGARDFVAKPVDPGARLPSGGSPPPGALLVGLSSTKSSIPFPVVARLSANGRRINRIFFTQKSRCRTAGRRARGSRASYDLQTTRYTYKLRNGSARRLSRVRETRAERRRGIRGRQTERFSARVTAAGMRAKMSASSRYRAPGYAERCRVRSGVLRAVPAG